MCVFFLFVNPIACRHISFLLSRFRQSFTDAEFANLCFEFGIECDGIVTEADIKGKGAKNPTDVWYARHGKGLRKGWLGP